MGYSVEIKCNISIDLNKKDTLAQILNNLDEFENLKFVEKGFSKLSLEDAFKSLNYYAIVENNAINITDFLLDRIASEDIIWSYLSRVVDDGSFLEFFGEDGEIWKWSFFNGKISELKGTVNYSNETISKTTNIANPFELLEINKNCSKDDINLAYKNKIKKFHPDLFSHLGEEFYTLANEKIKTFNVAKEKCLQIKGYCG